MDNEQYKHIGKFIAEGVPLEEVIDEVLCAMDVGEATAEFISGLIQFANKYDLEYESSCLEILNRAFDKVESSF